MIGNTLATLISDIDFNVFIEQVLRIVFAAFVGAAIGYEREIKNKPAGFFTFILVSVGSCIIAILQQNIYIETRDTIIQHPELADAIKIDQGRIIAQVVSGIGFLGAGTIIHNKGAAKGITTAAMLWLVAALGLMIGTGGMLNYLISLVTVIIIIPSTIFSRRLGDRLTRTRKVRRIRIVMDENGEKQLYDFLASIGVTVRKTFLVNKTVHENVNLKESIIYFSVPKNKRFNEIMELISTLDHVVEIEEA